MVSRHTETFRIRHDECDTYGVLNNAAYLRLAQEAAWRHSTVAGFGPDYYAGKQRGWLARDTEIEYFRPVRYGEALQVTTSVPSTRRALARRAYEFRATGSEVHVAQAHTDWVFFDLAASTPATIPAEIIEALFGKTTAPAPLKRNPFPEPPPAPPGAVTWRRKVEWRDIDPFGHLNNATYLSYAEEAAIEAGNHYGITHARSQEDGIGWVVSRSRIEYLKPAGVGDELEVVTYLGSVKPASAERHYAIFGGPAHELLARASSRWLTLDLATGRPRRLPAWVKEAFAPNVA